MTGEIGLCQSPKPRKLGLSKCRMPRNTKIKKSAKTVKHTVTEQNSGVQRQKNEVDNI